jgi:thiamine pyrophosphokinase
MQLGRRVVIVAGGECEQAELKRIDPQRDRIISADAGVLRLLEEGMIPHLAVGDFDTLGQEHVHKLEKMGISLICLPVEKAVTDTHFAIQEAIKWQPDQILLLGACGGDRLDHTLGNLSLLEWLDDQGITGVIHHRHNRVRFLSGPGTIELNQEYDYVSLLPVSEKIEGATTDGLKYPLVEETLFRADTRAISNEVIKERAWIKIRKGKCLVIESSEEGSR